MSFLCACCLKAAPAGARCPNCRWLDSENPEMQAHLPRHYVLLGRYYIGKVLGQGGFGVTYLARDQRLERLVAIKEYLPMEQCTRQTDRVTLTARTGDHDDMFKYGLQRFLDEAKSLAQFSTHPCIVSITDYAEANGTAYLMMTYMDGITLKQYLANHGSRISTPLAIQILMPVMDALREVHRHGLLHRDVSPDNIFLTQQGQVKLLDFGAARYAMGERSQNLSMILKPGFSPEEQYRSKGRQGPWTDVYAVAGTLYRSITGKVPPPAPDRLASDELVPPSKLASDLPPHLEPIILRGLAVRAEARFQTMEEFQSAVGGPSRPHSFAAQQPGPMPPPPPPPPPIQQPPTRNNQVLNPSPVQAKKPNPLLWVGLGLALLFIGLIGYGAIAAMHEHERQQALQVAERERQQALIEQQKRDEEEAERRRAQEEAQRKEQADAAQRKQEQEEQLMRNLNELADQKRQQEKVSQFWDKFDTMMDLAAVAYKPVVTVAIDNRCGQPVKAAIRFRSPDNSDWATIGWRDIPGNTQENTHIVTKNGIVYVYAENADHSLIWSGKEDDQGVTDEVVSDPLFFHADKGEELTGNGKRAVKMFHAQTKEWGTFPVVLTCK